MPAAAYVPSAPGTIATGRGLNPSTLGDTDNTFAWLEKACADHDVRLTFLTIERRWDPLRSDARFASLAKRMALQ